jgi:hypothetical protein
MAYVIGGVLIFEIKKYPMRSFAALLKRVSDWFCLE